MKDPIIQRITAADPENPASDTTPLEARVATIVAAPSTTSQPRRRRRTVMLAAAAALTLSAGVAVASGVPDLVMEMLTPELRPGTEVANLCNVDDPNSVRKVASTELADGSGSLAGTADLYVVRTTADELMTAILMTAPDGSPLGAQGGCGVSEDSRGQWAGAGSSYPDNNPDDGYAIISGRTTLDTDQVRIEFDTGATAIAEVQEDGYFLHIEPGDPRPYTEAGVRSTMTPVD